VSETNLNAVKLAALPSNYATNDWQHSRLKIYLLRDSKTHEHMCENKIDNRI